MFGNNEKMRFVLDKAEAGVGWVVEGASLWCSRKIEELPCPVKTNKLGVALFCLAVERVCVSDISPIGLVGL